MSDARRIEIEGDFEAACTHFAGAARLFDAGGFDDGGIDGAESAVVSARVPAECLRNFRNRIDPPET